MATWLSVVAVRQGGRVGESTASCRLRMAPRGRLPTNSSCSYRSLRRLMPGLDAHVHSSPLGEDWHELAIGA
jgi:hypothetical protein